MCCCSCQRSFVNGKRNGGGRKSYQAALQREGDGAEIYEAVESEEEEEEDSRGFEAVFLKHDCLDKRQREALYLVEVDDFVFVRLPLLRHPQVANPETGEGFRYEEE